jgi:hypothetical protein
MHCIGVSLFGVTEVWTQSFALAKQALCLLSYCSSPFCSGYFGGGVSRTLKSWSFWSQPPHSHEPPIPNLSLFNVCQSGPSLLICRNKQNKPNHLQVELLSFWFDSVGFSIPWYTVPLLSLSCKPWLGSLVRWFWVFVNKRQSRCYLSHHSIRPWCLLVFHFGIKLNH